MAKQIKKILVIHGPNLNLLGTREPEKYGSQTLDDINSSLQTLAQSLNVQAQDDGNSHIELTIVQSNNEALLVETLHEAKNQSIDSIIINPAAYTHTSVAMRDAILGVDIPFIEVHLSNIYKREPFRHHSYFSDIALGTITGLGAQGYLLALQALATTNNTI